MISTRVKRKQKQQEETAFKINDKIGENKAQSANNVKQE
jgi:hypothetical protein